jgi:excisionase family DNA binding protein
MSRGTGDPLLTIEEAADLLGTWPGHVRRLIGEGRLRVKDDEREERIPERALIEFAAREVA